ncbi:unnamed protein product, partial [Heterotrigona itama]
MYINTNTYFLPKNFIVHTFYGERTCFCWNQNELIIFPYGNNESVEVLTAPASIKTVQCFSGRIFLICIPQGIYKLSRDREFAVLSKSAIGMGTVFYEVLIPRNGYLYLDNKQKMSNKLLFKLSSKEINSSQLCVHLLNMESTTEYFMKALTNNYSTIENLCIIADGQKLLTLINENVQIIHSSIYSIRDIIPVWKNSKIVALLLATTTNVIVMIHSKDNTLIFETIYLKTEIQTICAGFSESSDDMLWIVYLYESEFYYVKKQLLVDNIHQIRVQDKNFVCLQSYDSKMILGLTQDKQLVEISINTIEKNLSIENDTFINLHSNMLEAATVIKEKIYTGTQELQVLNETLTTEIDKLKRINLYAHKDKVHFCPKITINYVANRLFLSANFHDVFPKSSWVVLNVKLEYQNLFCMKKVVNQETIIDIYIPENLAINFSRIAIDLITFKDKGHPWCIIRDYVISDYIEKQKKKRSNHDFINSKITKLETLIRERNINMKKLSEIKKS